jgi:hypothetical protein
VITGHPFNNVTDSIFEKIGVNLHQQAGHPIGIIKGAIYDYFDTQHPSLFAKFDDLAPVVTAKAVSSARVPPHVTHAEAVKQGQAMHGRGHQSGFAAAAAARLPACPPTSRAPPPPILPSFPAEL